jgi:hypothetical protein
MNQLKPDTWYYAYTDGKDLFVSDDAPKRNSKLRCWLHPDRNDLRIAGAPFRFETDSSKNIKQFYEEHKITG